MGFTSDLSEEDALLRARIDDACDLCEMRSCPRFVGFLDEHRQAVARAVLREKGTLSFLFYGGYEGAERTVLGVFPSFLPPDTELFPLKAIGFRYRRTAVLSHRDFLGSLMGCGVAREAIGDICVGTGFCDFFVTEEIAPYLLQNFTSAGRTKVKLSAIPLQQANIPQPETKEIRDSLASLRLDSVISAGFRIGRSAAAQLVVAGKTAVDGLPCEKPDKTVSSGVTITVRGLGKITLKTVNGQTKKGRISVVIDRYM